MTDLTYRSIIAAALALTTSCTSPEPAQDPASEAGSGSSSETGTLGSTSSGQETGSEQTGSASTAADGSSGGPSEADPAVFFAAIAGLWVAPVTSWTSAGSFPTMNMDVRAASEDVLFSRVDLDADNSVRFAFALEEHDGQAQLAYRNGGEFLGIPRDSRTILHETDGQVWRFCALAGGCGYIDARFDLSQTDTLRLDVDVLGMRHIEWIATRREARALGGAFPTPATQPGDAPFPPMPQLLVEASWDEPLAAPADVWVVLSTTPCGIDPLANCVPSRFMRAEAEAGATGVALTIDQIHPGAYRANAVLDRNQNMAAGILLPDSGDGVSWPLDAGADVPDSGVGTLPIDLDTTI